MKKFHIKTFGCQMNVYDSSRMADLLMEAGFQETKNVQEADVFIMNTCHIREKPKEKIFSELGKIRPFKKSKGSKGGYMVIVVAGCVAQSEGEKIIKRMPIVDIVLGPETYHKLPRLVQNIFEDRKKKEVCLDFLTQEKFDKLPKFREVKNVTEFITVQEGCDKFCSYCVVPYTRGREFSRTPEEILDEVLVLRDKGVKEVTLLGQNVDNYKGISKKGETKSLADLIHEIAQIEGIERIRYTTSYPSQFRQDLIDAHRDVEKLMPYIHLPIQSGSDRILKAMNRKYTVQEYLDIIEKIRESRPDIAISSDFIVGFGDETEKDFEDTLNLVDKVNYAQAFSFKYSVRPGTRGAKMTNSVSEEEKSERLVRLQELLDRQQLKFNKKFENKTLPVLVESISIKNKNALFGRTPYMQPIVFERNNKDLKKVIGSIVDVEVLEANTRSLRGH